MKLFIDLILVVIVLSGGRGWRLSKIGYTLKADRYTFARELVTQKETSTATKKRRPESLILTFWTPLFNYLLPFTFFKIK